MKLSRTIFGFLVAIFTVLLALLFYVSDWFNSAAGVIGFLAAVAGGIVVAYLLTWLIRALLDLE